MSIAGGLPRAVERGLQVECTALQIFTKSSNQWKARELGEEEMAAFREAVEQSPIGFVVAHDSYLINLASPDQELWKKSIDAMVVELQRADQLGIPYVVAHPGSYTTSSETAGLKKIIRGFNEVHKQTQDVAACCLLETTAGQGSNLGWRFEHLATILAGVKDPQRMGVCFDTCHVFAAGYPLGTVKQYKETMRQFNAAIGVKQIKAFHLNDSKKPLGSRVDRHHHIGQGHLGLEPFRNLLADRRFRKTPMYLETAKGEENGEQLDVMNLRTLRSLVE